MSTPLILLVDDEQEILTIYSTKLKQEGFEVITATNGATCLKLAKEKHPDLILLDVKMPAMNGVEVYNEIRKDPALRDIKVVFLTAFSDQIMFDSDIKFAQEIGTDLMKKGDSLNDFVNRVKQYLQK